MEQVRVWLKTTTASGPNMELCTSLTVIHVSPANEQFAIRATLQNYEVAFAARTETPLSIQDHTPLVCKRCQ